MNKLTIFKYPFEVTDLISIEMPKGAHALTVQTQGEIPCIWAIVDPEAPPEIRQFHCYGTGHPINIDISKTRYVGTFQLLGGRFIGHLFEGDRFSV